MPLSDRPLRGRSVSDFYTKKQHLNHRLAEQDGKRRHEDRQLWIPNGQSILVLSAKIVFWKLLQRRCHVLDRGSAVCCTNTPSRMSRDVIGHAFSDSCAVRTRLERVTPSVHRAQFLVRDPKFSHPICEPPTNDLRRVPFGIERIR
jgi:hypothetical protein